MTVTLQELQSFYTFHKNQSFLLANPEHFYSRTPLLTHDPTISILDSYNAYIKNQKSSSAYKNFASCVLQALILLEKLRVTHFIITDFDHWGFLQVTHIDCNRMIVTVKGNWIRFTNEKGIQDEVLITNCKRYIANLAKDREKDANGVLLKTFMHMRECIRNATDWNLVHQK